MTLQLQLSDNTYPKEEIGRGGLTGTALPRIWTSKPKSSWSFSKLPSRKVAFPLTEYMAGVQAQKATQIKRVRDKRVQRLISAAACSLG